MCGAVSFSANLMDFTFLNATSQGKCTAPFAIYLQIHTVLKPRRPAPISSPL
jgi:hypothetical protein